MKKLCITLILCSFPVWVFAAPKTPEHWQTPTSWSNQTRVRYQHLLQSFRCLVCQDESLAASSAGLAADLRRQIRHMMEEGQTDKQIRKYMVDRYGQFVLYEPPFRPSTWLLWFGPFVLLALGLGAVVLISRRKSAARPVSPDMLEYSRRILEQEDQER